ncbi:hypothetical protein F7725_006666 [Dissostichus mawsoni]|uniref:Uncharacterized protein n=1 Tax=Dissostichus mawsoni TaxID=36200 RepID=A0A7J5XUI7_DISMA|nr:hypothetical protein F7725_006666 [Dissostichus mawsoni]
MTGVDHIVKSTLRRYSVKMASSIMDGLGKAVVGVWRAHTVLDESDDAQSPQEAPDRFRKLRSSSSLNSLRMSLRKRLPLRSVQTNSLPENPTWEAQKEQPKPSKVHKLTRSARNSVTGVYQKLQRSRECAHEECLVATPGSWRIKPSHPKTYAWQSCNPETDAPSSSHSQAYPRLQRKKDPEAAVRGVRTGGGRRQLVRMAALRSPFASPNTETREYLDSVSSGIRRLKHLSKAFENIIGRDKGTSTKECSGGAVMRKLDPSGKLSRSNLTRRASNLSTTVGGWAHTAVNTICKPN